MTCKCFFCKERNWSRTHTALVAKVQADNVLDLIDDLIDAAANANYSVFGDTTNLYAARTKLVEAIAGLALT